MLDQNTFIETVQSVAEIIRTSAEPIGRDEIMSYFKDMELNKAQEDIKIFCWNVFRRIPRWGSR